MTASLAVFESPMQPGVVQVSIHVDGPNERGARIDVSRDFLYNLSWANGVPREIIEIVRSLCSSVDIPTDSFDESMSDVSRDFEGRTHSLYNRPIQWVSSPATARSATFTIRHADGTETAHEFDLENQHMLPGDGIRFNLNIDGEPFNRAVNEFNVSLRDLRVSFSGVFAIPHAQLGADYSQSYQDRLAADERAERLLKSHLSEFQKITYANKGGFYVDGGKTGRTYWVEKRDSFNVLVFGQSKSIHDAIGRLCVTHTEPVPMADLLLTDLMLLKYDEIRFLKTANVSESNPWGATRTFVMEAIDKYG